MRKYLIIAFFLLHLQVQAQDTNAQKMEVMMKMASLRNALLSKDSIALSSLLSDDVTYGHTNGIIQTKSQLIHSVMSGEQDYKSITPSDMNVRIYNETAVVTMKSKTNLIYSGKPLDLNMYITLVWIKLNSDWKLEARQSVKLPE